MWGKPSVVMVPAQESLAQDREYLVVTITDLVLTVCAVSCPDQQADDPALNILSTKETLFLTYQTI